MRYHDSMQLAREQQMKAQSFLQQKKLTPNPINYAVAYEYVSNSNDLLKSKVDDCPSLDNFRCEQIFHDCILKDSHLNQKTVDNMDESINSLNGSCTQSQEILNDYVSNLELGMQQMESSTKDQLKNMIMKLDEESRKVIEHQTKLIADLEKTSMQSQQLKIEFDKIKKESTTDALTGLFNRNGMMQQIEIWTQQNRSHPMMAIAIDIDHFKLFNDQFGHLIGDVVLAKVAQQIKKYVMDLGAPVRYGGEEFLILLPESSMDTALEVAEEVRKAVHKMRFISAKNKTKLPPISISAGVAGKRSDDELEDLIGRADEALYKAKDGGRNQVISEITPG